MPVQFPRDFAIPNLVEIKITDLVKSLLGCLFAVHPVEMPMDWIAVIQIFVTEEIKLVAADFVRLPNDLLGLLRGSLTKQAENSLDGRGREEKLGRSDIRRTNHSRTNHALQKIESQTRKDDVGTLGNFLPATIQEFVPIHARQT